MNRFVSFAAASFMALALQAGAALAQSEIAETQLEAARTVVTASGMARSFDAIIPGVQEAIRRQLVTQPTLARDANEVFEALEPEMELQRRAMINRAARIIAQRMNEEELRAVGEFYNSDAGRRYVEMQPLFLEDIFGAMDAWSDEMAEYVQIRVRAEMQQRGHQMN